MDILNTVSLESNSQTKINFDGDDLTSNAGLLLFKEFLFKIGLVKLINRFFETNDTVSFRIHKDDVSLMQVIYQIICAYFEDECTDELTNEPVITASPEKMLLCHSCLTEWMRISWDSSTSSSANCARSFIPSGKRNLCFLILALPFLIPTEIRKERASSAIILSFRLRSPMNRFICIRLSSPHRRWHPIK